MIEAPQESSWQRSLDSLAKLQIDDSLRRCFWLAGILVILVYVTANNYQGGDAPSYLAIAEAAPDHPETKLPYHHAQRFAIPYAIGFVAHYMKLPPASLLTAISLLIMVAAAATLVLLARELGVDETGIMLMTALFILNPYAFRYYLCSPPMLNDSSFVVGTLLTCYGLSSRRLWWFAGGVVIAALARQTAILLIPGWLAWLYWVRSPAGKHRHAFAGGAVAFTILTYVVTGRIAEGFALPAWNFTHVVGIFDWLRNGFNSRELVMFCVRLTLTFVMALAVCGPAIWHHRHRLGERFFGDRRIACLALIGLAIISQPILAGPALSLRDVQRLAGIGLGPLLAALFLLAPATIPRRWLMTVIGLLFFGSLHHLFSFYGPAEHLRVHFSALYLGIGVAIAFIMTAPAERRQPATT